MNETVHAKRANPLAGAISGLLFVPQVIISAVVIFLIYFQGMSSAGCGGSCDFEAAGAAQMMLISVVALISVATLITLILLRRREWRNWPIALLGVFATLGVFALASQLLAAALSVS